MAKRAFAIVRRGAEVRVAGSLESEVARALVIAFVDVRPTEGEEERWRSGRKAELTYRAAAGLRGLNADVEEAAQLPLADMKHDIVFQFGRPRAKGFWDVPMEIAVEWDAPLTDADFW